MIRAIGYLGAALLALCGLPLLFVTRAGDKLFLWAWWAGEVCMGAYTLAVVQDARAAPLLLNYGANIALVSIILWRRLRA